MNRAFTLLEVVITVALFVVVMLALIELYIHSNTIYVYESTFVDVARGADDTMKAIGTYAIPADQVVALRTFPSGAFQTSTTTLILELPSIDSSGNTIPSTYDYLVFYTNGSNSYRSIDANAASARTSTTRKLSDKVASLTFSYDNADYTQATAITVNIQTYGTAKSATTTNALTQTFHLRNVNTP